MPVNGVLIALIALAITFLAAQQYFYATYRRKHPGAWRPIRRRLPMGPTGQELGALLGATMRRDDDPQVERARRVYLVAFAVVVAAALWAVISESSLPR